MNHFKKPTKMPEYPCLYTGRFSASGISLVPIPGEVFELVTPWQRLETDKAHILMPVKFKDRWRSIKLETDVALAIAERLTALVTQLKNGVQAMNVTDVNQEQQPVDVETPAATPPAAPPPAPTDDRTITALFELHNSVQSLTGQVKALADSLAATKAHFAMIVASRPDDLDMPPSADPMPMFQPSRVFRPGKIMKDAERYLISQVLREHNGHREKTAKALGIGVRTLGMKLQQYRQDDLGKSCAAENPGCDNAPSPSIKQAV